MTANYMREFGQRLKKLREERGMTQTEFGKAIGKCLRSVQKYESGDIDISLSMLYSISEVLGVTISFLTNCQVPDAAKVTILRRNKQQVRTTKP